MTDVIPAPPSPPFDKRAAKAQAQAEKAYKKASRSWYQKKRFIIPLVLVMLAVLSSVLGETDEGADQTVSPSVDERVEVPQADAPAVEDTALFPDRPDRQPKDVEREVGGTVEVGGWAATLRSAEFAPSLSEFESDGYLVLDVELVNNSDRAQHYSSFDWRVQTPSGTVRDIEFVMVEGELETADLVQGATTSGKVFFNVGEEKGTFYVLYKPGLFDATRGVWGIDL